MGKTCFFSPGIGWNNCPRINPGSNRSVSDRSGVLKRKNTGRAKEPVPFDR